MARRFRKSNPTTNEFFEGKHRREHWYRDNSIYFITARCVDRFPAFASDSAKAIFWDRFDHWTSKHSYVQIVTTVMNNHYHTLGYKKNADDFGEMMRKVHGSVAKLVNDILPERHVPFWRTGHDDYFDGCLRDVLQFRRTYDYVLKQAVRHGIVRESRAYPHTRVQVDIEPALKRAVELGAFMEDVPYKRYEHWRSKRGG